MNQRYCVQQYDARLRGMKPKHLKQLVSLQGLLLLSSNGGSELVLVGGCKAAVCVLDNTASDGEGNDEQ